MMLIRRREAYHVEIHSDDMALETFIEENEGFVEIKIRNTVLYVCDRIVVAHVPNSDQVPALSKILMDTKFFIDMETEYLE